MQSNNFTTLFVLSRQREVEDSVLDVSYLFLILVMTGTELTYNWTGLDRQSWTFGFQS